MQKLTSSGSIPIDSIEHLTYVQATLMMQGFQPFVIESFYSSLQEEYKEKTIRQPLVKLGFYIDIYRRQFYLTNVLFTNVITLEIPMPD